MKDEDAMNESSNFGVEISRPGRALADLRREVGMAFSLWSLLQLQYEHEGHIDKPILDLLTKTLAELPDYLFAYTQLVDVSDLPF